MVSAHCSVAMAEIQENRSGTTVKETVGCLTDAEEMMGATHRVGQEAKERYRMPVAVIGARRMSVETAVCSCQSGRVYSGVEMAQSSEVGNSPTGAGAAGCTVSGSWAGVPEAEGWIVERDYNFLLEAIGCTAEPEGSTGFQNSHMDLSAHS